MDSREEFELKLARPRNIEWEASESEYICTEDADPQDENLAEIYQSYWEAWKIAADLYKPQIEKLQARVNELEEAARKACDG